MSRTVLIFGLIAGVILSLMMIITIPFHEEIGPDRGMVIGYTTMVLAFLLIFFGVRSYRDNVAGGTVSFGRALSVGMLIVVVAAVCYVATWEIMYFKAVPTLQASFHQQMLEQARSSAGTQAEIDKKVAEVEKFTRMYKNPAINAAFTFIEPLPVGLIIALVSAGILRRKREEAAAEGVVERTA
jgi:hypothetical protein